MIFYKKHLVLGVLLFTLLLCAQCKKDEVNNVITTKDYLPQNEGSSFTYKYVNSNGTSEHTYTISANDTVHNSRTYKKYISADTISEFYTKTGTGYYHLISIPALQVMNYDNNYLNENLDVNALWKDSVAINNPLGFPPLVNIVFVYKVVEKGITKLVNGNTFSDVIHIKLLDASVESLVVGMATGDFYYSKGVGMIQSNVDIPDNPTFGINEYTSVQTLIAYNIK